MDSNDNSAPRMDKTISSVASLHDASDDLQFWQKKTPQERLQAVEFMRQVMYGDHPSARLQRFFEIARLGGD